MNGFLGFLFAITLAVFRAAGLNAAAGHADLNLTPSTFSLLTLLRKGLSCLRVGFED